MSEEWGRLNFKIGGDFITKHARNLVIEDRWEDALYFLTDCINGSDYDIAVSVLTGEKRFVGVNDLELEDEEPEVRERLEEDLRFHFCGIFKDKNEYWRPYAYVTSWCEEDLNRKAMTENRYCSYSGPAPLQYTTRMTDWANARNNFYMNNRRDDKSIWARLNGDEVAVLWAQVRVPPPWMKFPKECQQAVDDFLEHRWLDKRGGFALYDDRDAAEHDVRETSPSAERIAAREKFEREQDERFQTEYAVIAEKVQVHSLEMSNGWLSPAGKLIGCLYSEHDFFALVILETEYKVTKTDVLTSRGDALVKRGWVKLQKNEWWTHHTDFCVTQRQYDTIWDHSQKHNVKMPKLDVK